MSDQTPEPYTPSCAYSGCQFPLHAKGFCRAHYAQNRSGRQMVKARPRDPKARFMEKVEKQDSNGCWLWAGFTSAGGSGQISVSGIRGRQAHRVSYELFVGQIPDGKEIDHVCAVRICVNPTHLRLATRSENQQNLSNLSSKKSGHKNVNWHETSQSWLVRVKLAGVATSFGYYKDLDEAVKKAEEARSQMHPFRRKIMSDGARADALDPKEKN